LSEVTLDTSQC